MTPKAPAFHPLGVGELLDAAIYVYRKNFVTLMGIGAVMAVPIMLIQSAVAVFDPAFNQPVGGAFTPFCECANRDLEILASFYLAYNAVSALLGPAVIVIQVGAFTFAVSEGRMGRRVTIGGAYRHAFRRWLSLLISAILIQLAVLAAFIPLILPLYQLSHAGYLSGETPGLLVVLVVLAAFYIPLIFPSVYWSLTAPAIMLENLGVFKAMGRSWRLVAKSFWRAFAVLLIAGLLVHLLTYAVFVAVQYAASLLPYSLVFQTLVISAGGVIAGTAIQPLAYVALTLLYYDLRVRHEGYDLQLALEQLKQPGTAVAAEGRA